MKLAAVRAGDVVAIPGPRDPRLGEVRAKHRGRLTVSPWPSRQTHDRGPLTVSARDVLAHYRRRARASAADVGDLVLVDIRGRRFHARVTARPERGELRLDPSPPASTTSAPGRATCRHAGRRTDRCRDTTPEGAAMAESYTVRAGQAVLEAARNEHDFGGWLAHVLAAAAAELGSTDALTAGRPGSWEAEFVQRLVKGTVGWDDEYLADHKTLADHG
jgi:hypothetical protein